MAQPGSPIADRRALANSLRELREGAGLSLEQAATEALDASGAKLSRLETGKQVPGPRDVRDLCVLYGASMEVTEQLMSWAVSAREPGWWDSYAVNDDDFVGLESAASRIEEFAATYIPGLLQTPEYAEAFVGAVMGSGKTRPWTKKEISQWLEIRERRQRILVPESGVRLAFVVDEAALRRAVGGAQMKNQIEHLMTVSQQSNLDVRILPFSSGASPAQRGSFIVLTLSDSPDIAYLETQAGFLLLDEQEEVRRFRRMFHAIQSSALKQSETLEALARAMHALPEG